MWFAGRLPQSAYTLNQGPGEIRIVDDTTGSVVTKTESTPDGWWRADIVSSNEGFVLPVPLRLLGPSEDVHGKYSLEDLMLGLSITGNAPDYKSFLIGKRVKVRVRIYGDGYLKKSIIAESEWVTIK